MNTDYYRISRGAKQLYIEVYGKKREEVSEFLDQNSEVLKRAQVTVEVINESDFMAGRILSGMPNIGKGIESCLVE